MIYLTGDTHGDFSRVEFFCYRFDVTKKDILIVLGDAGINYFKGEKADALKKQLSNLPLTIFCIHGNHEARPSTIPTYNLKEWHGGKVYVEEAYQNIIFAKDGEVFQFGNLSMLVIGGAYSVDKYLRLENGWNWFPDEQPSDEVKTEVEKRIKEIHNTVDVVLTHTCPAKYIPVESFLPEFDQSRVDKSTEKWLDTIENKLDYKKWYCGHYHIDKSIDKLRFMFKDIIKLNVKRGVFVFLVPFFTAAL